MNSTELIQSLISEAQSVTDEAREKFSLLSSEQLNWKPAPEVWSIGQIFDHLITTNSQYFLPLQKIMKENHDQKQGGKEFSSSFIGKMFIRQLDPSSTTKVKVPKVFEPSQSRIPDSIIRDFVRHQEELINFIRNAEKFDLNKIRITSPASKLLRFKLGDALKILTTHERRHLAQATRLMQNKNFPKA